MDRHFPTEKKSAIAVNAQKETQSHLRQQPAIEVVPTPASIDPPKQTVLEVPPVPKTPKMRSCREQISNAPAAGKRFMSSSAALQ